MRTWKSGAFDREKISSFAHPFTPARAVESLHQLDVTALWSAGKRLLLLDVDSTIIHWHGETCPDEVLTWLKEAKQAGFDICLISNTNRVDRLKRIASIVGADIVRGRPKPSRAMYRLALIKFHRKAEEALMIGDQLVTDVFGANRSGIEAIWVRKMEGEEFRGTKINRMIERMLIGPIYQGLIAPVDEASESAAAERAKPVAQRVIIHQIVKFCFVGGASFVVDFGFTFIFMKVIHVNGQLMSDELGMYLQRNLSFLFGFAKTYGGAAAPVLGGIASLIAMMGSFLMNRAWTFSVKGREERGKQMRRFYLVSILGQMINLGIFTTCYNAIGGKQLLISKMAGAAVAAFWNFTGSRYYAFRAHATSPTQSATHEGA